MRGGTLETISRLHLVSRTQSTCPMKWLLNVSGRDFRDGLKHLVFRRLAILREIKAC